MDNMTDHAIVADGLVKRFGRVVALDGVDLRVPRGSVLGLLGPNGAGKTTAVRILTTILRPDAGRAEILGVDVTRHPDEVRRHIGLTGQFAAIDDNLTGRENLRLVGKLTHLERRSREERADQLLDLFDLVDAADRPARTYSGGMRRRLDLAAALVHAPPVLVLDEPTTGLDPRSRSDLWSLISDLVTRGTTLLLTTQYLEEADRLADRISVVDHGRVIAEGTAQELKARLGSTIIHVEFVDSDRIDEAKGVLSELGPTDLGDDRQSIEIKVTDGAHSLLQAVRRLDGAGLQPTGVTVREPSLDDVFLTLTGRHVEETETEEAT